MFTHHDVGKHTRASDEAREKILRNIHEDFEIRARNGKDLKGQRRELKITLTTSGSKAVDLVRIDAQVVIGKVEERKLHTKFKPERRGGPSSSFLRPLSPPFPFTQVSHHSAGLSSQADRERQSCKGITGSFLAPDICLSKGPTVATCYSESAKIVLSTNFKKDRLKILLVKRWISYAGPVTCTRYLMTGVAPRTIIALKLDDCPTSSCVHLYNMSTAQWPGSVGFM